MSSAHDRPETIARLYEVFARYPARLGMPRCEHCVSQREIDQICRRPLGDLTADDLANYAWHALWTIGDADDFRHFLPRVVEVMLWDEDRTECGPESFFGKFHDANWFEWPANEQQAIREFMAAWWRHVLSQPPDKHEALSCLCGIARLEGDLAEYLACWRSAEGVNPLLHLAEILLCVGPLPTHDQMASDVYWQNIPTQAAQVANWFTDPRTRHQLEAGFFAHAETPCAEDLSDAAEMHACVFRASTGD